MTTSCRFRESDRIPDRLRSQPGAVGADEDHLGITLADSGGQRLAEPVSKVVAVLDIHAEASGLQPAGVVQCFLQTFR